MTRVSLAILLVVVSLAGCGDSDPAPASNIQTCAPSAGGVELCDGIDNDCDGSVDEEFSMVGTPCTAGQDVCAVTGAWVCGTDQVSVVCDAVVDAECEASPCTQACDGETPVCDTASNTCVGCVGTPDCDSGVCDTASKTCVNCLEDTDCTSGVCKPGASAAENVCVGCVSTADCTTASASVCGADNTCGGCETAADCGHIAGTTQCVAGACVGCTPDTQAADCDGKVCAPSTLTCTDVALASVLALSACQYDAQCQAGHTCVALNYAGNPHGSYCMPLFTGTSCGRPYGLGDVSRTSVDGANVNVCMIAESLTTPEAIADYNSPCTEATAATDCPADGARCEVYDPSSASQSRVCTYTCSGPNDCFQGSTCLLTAGQYCGAP